MTTARRSERYGPSLTTRLVAMTVAVALLGGAATLGVAYQLVRVSLVQQSQRDLRATARGVAVSPASDRAALVRGLDRSGDRGIHVLLVRADGTVVPRGGAELPAALRTASGRDGAGAARIRVAGRDFLVERLRARGGDTVIAVQDLSLVRSALGRLFGSFLLAALAGAAIAAVIGALVARRLVRPLRRAAVVARRLAAGERGVVPAGMPGSPVGEVAAVDAALRSLDAALTASEGRQREFLLSVSHEMRTPLTGIRGYADALADGLIPASRAAEVGRTLSLETRRLDDFIRDLLELARLQSDDFRIVRAPFDLDDLVARAATAWRAQADAADVDLAVDRASGTAALICDSDPMRVRQLLDGLLENTLRAAPAGTAVLIGTRRDLEDPAGRVVLSVHDDGPGLTDADLADAFEPGVLADRYRTARPVGTGLGLSIAGRLVGRLGGRIHIVSDAGGTEFVITLPSAPSR